MSNMSVDEAVWILGSGSGVAVMSYSTKKTNRGCMSCIVCRDRVEGFILPYQ